jgi:hypothetical protein
MSVDGRDYTVRTTRLQSRSDDKEEAEDTNPSAIKISLPRFWKYNRCPVKLEPWDVSVVDRGAASSSSFLLQNVACILGLLAALRNSLVHDKSKLLLYRGAVERIATGLISVARDCTGLTAAAGATVIQAVTSIVSELRMLSN